jgi:tetratricopeptide (TPR) repeat protein
MRYIIASALLASAAVLAQEQQQSAQQLFEAGQTDQALRAIAQRRERGEAGPSDTFLAAHILLKAGQNDRARAEFESLTALEDQAWQRIGEAAVAGLGSDSQKALESAAAAAKMAPDRFEAHYQLGYARALANDWAGSATAMARAIELNPTFAYAHYNAGQAYSRSNQTDRTAQHFERFLKLAPKAPERAAVESLMRTLRGR